MSHSQMLLCVQLINGYGAHPGAWRMAGVDPASYTDMDVFVGYAQAAERGKIQTLFFADTPVLDVDLASEPPHFPIDPIVVMTAIARETERLGLVATASTTFNEPYNLARQFKALDVISRGRVGWNAVTTSDPLAAANFGAKPLQRQEKYERAHEMIQVVQALWGSWSENALRADTARGVFADPAQVVPIDLRGRHVAARGPLPIPPSPQGQPVIFQAGGGAAGLALAGSYATGVYANPFDIASGRAKRDALRFGAVRAGRQADEVKLFAGLMPSIADSRENAVARRRFMDQVVDVRQRIRYLGGMVGLDLSRHDIDRPLPETEYQQAHADPSDPRAPRALAVLREGWSLRDVVAHGVVDYHPVVAGTAADVADHMQTWFEAGACDGFSIAIDSLHDGLDRFVDEVVPILQARGLFQLDYAGTTLREHLGAPYQYGRDARL